MLKFLKNFFLLLIFGMFILQWIAYLPYSIPVLGLENPIFHDANFLNLFGIESKIPINAKILLPSEFLPQHIQMFYWNPVYSFSWVFCTFIGGNLTNTYNGFYILLTLGLWIIIFRNSSTPTYRRSILMVFIAIIEIILLGQLGTSCIGLILSIQLGIFSYLSWNQGQRILAAGLWILTSFHSSFLGLSLLPWLLFLCLYLLLRYRNSPPPLPTFRTIVILFAIGYIFSIALLWEQYQYTLMSHEYIDPPVFDFFRSNITNFGWQAYLLICSIFLFYVGLWAYHPKKKIHFLIWTLDQKSGPIIFSLLFLLIAFFKPTPYAKSPLKTQSINTEDYLNPNIQKDHIPFPYLVSNAEISDTKSNDDNTITYPLLYLSTDDKNPLSNYSGNNLTLTTPIKSHQIVLTASLDQSLSLIFNQNPMSSWQVFVNDQLTPIQTTTQNRMKINLSAGTYKIQWKFWPGRMIHLYFLFIGIGIIIVSKLLYRRFPLIGMFTIIPIIFVCHGFIHGFQYPKPMPIENPDKNEIFTFNYEYLQPYWKIYPQQININRAAQGFRSEKIDKKTGYSATFRYDFTSRKHPISDIQYKVKLWAEQIIKFGAVLVVYKKDKEDLLIDYRTIDNVQKWTEVEGQFNLKSELTTPDSIVFYLWNYNAEEFWIDDVKMEIKQ